MSMREKIAGAIETAAGESLDKRRLRELLAEKRADVHQLEQRLSVVRHEAQELETCLRVLAKIGAK